MYHNISNGFEFSFRSISKDLLKKHIKSLYENKIRFLTNEDIAQNTIFDGKDAVLITFDDAYEGVYNYALPVMEKYGVIGAVFIPAGYIGKFNSWDFSPFRGLKHMDKNMLINLSKKGWIIGSHGFNHVDLRKCSDKALKMEICDSKKLLEDLLGKRISLFAYPFGLYNRKVIDMVAECGYDYAFATATGIKRNRFAIRRMAVYFIDPSPLPILNNKYCPLYLFRNRIIASLASLTPVYKSLFGVSKIQC